MAFWIGRLPRPRINIPCIRMCCCCNCYAHFVDQFHGALQASNNQRKNKFINDNNEWRTTICMEKKTTKFHRLMAHTSQHSMRRTKSAVGRWNDRFSVRQFAVCSVNYFKLMNASLFPLLQTAHYNLSFVWWIHINFSRYQHRRAHILRNGRDSIFGLRHALQPINEQTNDQTNKRRRK